MARKCALKRLKSTNKRITAMKKRLDRHENELKDLNGILKILKRGKRKGSNVRLIVNEKELQLLRKKGIQLKILKRIK
jgi:hypothetical protein